MSGWGKIRVHVFLWVLFFIPIKNIYSEDVVIDNFSLYKPDQFPKNEEKNEMWGIWSRNFFSTDQYKVRAEGGNQYLESYVNESISKKVDEEEEEEELDIKVVRLIKKSKYEAKEFPYLRWKWRVHVFPTGSQEDVQYLNDSAASVYVYFLRHIGSPKIINYVWSRTLPAGKVFKNPSWSEDFPTYFKIVRSGPGPQDEKGELWVEEEVNVYQDFINIYVKENPDIYYRTTESGEKVLDLPPILGIGILTDANNTRSEAKADYDDFVRSSKKQH